MPAPRMKRSAPMTRTGFKPKAASISGLLRTSDFASDAGKFNLKKFTKLCRKAPSAASVKSGKRMRAAQRPVSPAEKILWNQMASLIGCIACRIDGRFNTHVSIHHVDGRTKPGCHKRVLPLCAPHHQQDDTDPLARIAVHPNKNRFEIRYGTQCELLARVMNILGAGQ